MATLADIRQRVLDYLYSAEPQARPSLYRINGAVANGTTETIVVDDGTKFNAGNIIEFQDNGEQCYVMSVSTNTLTVIRGHNGTTAASHLDNTVLAKNPRFSMKQAEDSITGTLFDLERHGVHSFGEGSLTLVANQYFYDLSEVDISQQYGVLSFHYEDTTLDTRIQTLPFYRDIVHSSISAGTYAVRLLSWGTLNAGDTVYYTYARQIDSVADLLSRQEEMVVLGAVAKMLARTMGPRTQDPGKHTDRTVQPGQGARDSRWFQGEFYLAAKAEAALLAAERQRHAKDTKSRRAARWAP